MKFISICFLDWVDGRGSFLGMMIESEVLKVGELYFRGVFGFVGIKIGEIRGLGRFMGVL